MKVIEPIKNYHSNPAISRSKLMLIGESPEKFNYFLNNPVPSTEAQILGSAVHKLALERQDFDKEFAVEPVVNKRTNEGRQILAEFYFDNSEKTIITSTIYETALKMVASLESNPKAVFLLNGDVERSYYTTDNLTGEAVKCRPDVTKTIKGKGLIVDLKTCCHADNETFAKEAIKYGYDVQAAMYKEIVEKETGLSHDVIFVAVEKSEPFSVNILQADDLFLEYGNRRYREFLGTYHECKENNAWYGYLGFANAINRLTLPAYLLKEIQ